MRGRQSWNLCMYGSHSCKHQRTEYKKFGLHHELCICVSSRESNTIQVNICKSKCSASLLLLSQRSSTCVGGSFRCRSEQSWPLNKAVRCKDLCLCTKWANCSLNLLSCRYDLLASCDSLLLFFGVEQMACVQI